MTLAAQHPHINVSVQCFQIQNSMFLSFFHIICSSFVVLLHSTSFSLNPCSSLMMISFGFICQWVHYLHTAFFSFCSSLVMISFGFICQHQSVCVCVCGPITSTHTQNNLLACLLAPLFPCDEFSLDSPYQPECVGPLPPHTAGSALPFCYSLH